MNVPEQEKATAAREAPRARVQANAGRWVGRVQWISAAAILLGIVAMVRLLPMDRIVHELSQQLEDLGYWGPVAFAAIYVISAVLLVPGSALTIASGALFGLLSGTVVVSIASTLAAGLAFNITRYLARGSVARRAGQNRKFEAIDGAIGARGWTIVALLRLSPVMPFNLSNYLFGLTAIRFWPYLVTSWLTMLPGTFLYVYLGYVGRMGLAATSGGNASGGVGRWALLLVGLAATVAVTVYVTRIARKAIRERTRIDEEPAHGPDRKEPTVAAPARGRPKRAVAAAILAAFVLAATAYAYLNRAALNRFFGPPSVAQAEAYEEKAGGPAFDHTLFDTLLKHYVDKEGRVDYGGIKADTKLLDAYIEVLAKAPVDQLGRNERLALLLNAYNAFTLRLVQDNYPVRSIKDIPAEKRWEDRRWKLGTYVVSLEEIEDEWIRPNFKEPRVHFALVCAAVGCPPLRSEAYSAGRLEEQLDEQARSVHGDRRWFAFFHAGGKGVVQLTSLYRWYAGDFEQAAGSVLNFAARYSSELRAALGAGDRPRIEWLDYDWSLNNLERVR
jgi:uncharacterized membrane protein YdjX (TVP38/TMEM64 family)